MTPKQRAKELIEKMQVMHYVKLEANNTKGLPVSMYGSQVKSCAIICAEQVIDSLKQLDQKDLKVKWELMHWKEVKKEVEKL